MGGYKNSITDINGNIGIGTSSPIFNLDITSNQDSVGLRILNNTTTGYAPGSILLEAGQSNSRGQGIYHFNSAADENWFTGVPYNVLSKKWIVANYANANFNTGTAQLQHALLTIDSDTGNVGIGATSPTGKLEVAGSVHLSQGTGNSYVGTDAGNLGTSTGINNSAFGVDALYSNTTGGSNVANGYRALHLNTTGSSNVANGYASLYFNDTGNNNVANGVDALLFNTTGSNNTASGRDALRSNTTGSSNVANGYQSLNSNTTGGFNTANGFQALYYNTTGYSNSANGYRALFLNTTGAQNTANGLNALNFNTTGNNNVANGVSALYNNTTGSYNTANGLNALFSNTTGGNNVAIGTESLRISTASNNTATGYQSLYYNTTGTSNVVNGYQALYNNTTGNNNVAIGKGSGIALTTGSNNTIIGSVAGTAGMSDTVIIAAGATERLRIDSNGNVGIGTSSPNASLHILDAVTPSIKLEDTTNSNQGRIRVANNYMYIDIDNPDTVGSSRIVFMADSTQSLYLTDTEAVFETTNVGIGTTSPSAKLDVVGTIECTSLTETSALRFKENIQEDIDASIIDKLRPVSYDWKEDKKKDYGFIAEEVNELDSTLTTQDEEGEMIGIKYTKLIPFLVKKIQEQEERIKQLENGKS